MFRIHNFEICKTFQIFVESFKSNNKKKLFLAHHFLNDFIISLGICNCSCWPKSEHFTIISASYESKSQKLQKKGEIFEAKQIRQKFLFDICFS